jgi:hypothetical protein
MPDATIQSVVFPVGAADADKLRAAWQAAQARYAPQLAARQIDLGQALGQALDQWAASYTAFNDLVSELIRQKALWTTIAPLTRAKIKTAARALQMDAAAVARDAASSLAAVQALGDPAEKELTSLLTAISRRAADHQQRAALTARAR